MWRFDARADHLCFEALNVVLRSFKGVNVLLDKGVVVARRGVTLGAIVTLGRVEERRVDAWDWALALSGIFFARAALRGPRCSKGFLNQEGALRRIGASGSGSGFVGLATTYNTALVPMALNAGSGAHFCLIC